MINSCFLLESGSWAGHPDATGRLAWRPEAATLAHQAIRGTSGWNSQPFGARLHDHRPPNTKWVTDISYVRTAAHWLYLHVVLDVYSELVVGWSMSARQDCRLVVQAVLMAIWQRPTRTLLMLHSDRGCQCTADGYQQFLVAHQMTCRMSVIGNCANNAAAESFFGRLKGERVNRRQYRTRNEARADIVDYIERWHNPRQRRRLDQQRQREKLLAQLSVETG